MIALTSFGLTAQFNRQMISSQGATLKNRSGLVVTQTVGQASITGTFSNSLINISQGFQQSNWDSIIFQNNTPQTNINIYPNPFKDVIKIVHNLKDNFEVLIFDTSGKIVFKRKFLFSNTLESINLKTLSSGLYLVNLKSKKVNLFTKLVKQ